MDIEPVRSVAFLEFLVAALCGGTGEKSATAAVNTPASHCGHTEAAASSMCRAEPTLCRAIPAGSHGVPGPQTASTHAPRSHAATATAAPILPGRRVGPETQPVPVLAGRAKCDHNPYAFHILRGQRAQSGEINLAQVGKAPLSLFTARRAPATGLDHGAPPFTEGGDVGLAWPDGSTWPDSWRGR